MVESASSVTVAAKPSTLRIKSRVRHRPTMATEARQHGVKGVYLGGDWMPIEECTKRVEQLNSSDKCDHACETCPRSRSRKTSAKSDGSYDVVIIGAGCIGGAIARELSKYTSSILLLEAADDVTQGATKGNSGIVHAGFDDKPGSTRAKFCWPGNQMFPKLDEELHFGYQRNGSLVLARGPEEELVLQELLERGRQNGVKRLKILKRDEVFAMEPYVNEQVTAALYSPDAGNLIPYEYAIALAENAVDNGVELRIRREVKEITPDADHKGYTIKARHWEPRNYVEAMKKEAAKKEKAAKGKARGEGDSRLGTHVMIGMSSGYALGAIMMKNLLPLAQKQLPQHAELIGSVLKVPLAVYAVCVVVCSLLGYLMHQVIGEKPKPVEVTPLSALDIPSVGESGKMVSVEQMAIGGSGGSAAMDGETVEVETIRTTFVVNAAGCYSDKVAGMIGDHSFKIKPRLGDYVLLNRNQGHLAKTTLFPCPHPVLGKGVLVQTTLWGNLILGPTARDMHLPEVAAETTEDILTFILGKCKQLVPSFDAKEVIHTFSGSRAKNSTGDWVIGVSEASAQFINAAGIDSPGLAGSPAIALEIVRLLQGAGLKLVKNTKFNPVRAPIIVPKDGWKGIKAGPVGKVTDPKQNIVCKCEKVTEAEVITALHRSLPVDSTQAIRKRTRAGMGHCQGDAENYNCECRVADIIARETGLPAEAVGRRPWPATSSLPRRWLSDAQKEDIDAVSKKAEALFK